MTELGVQSPRSHGRDTARRGFTLIEALVVIIIISVLASVAAPRFLNSAARVGDAEADGVQRLLSTAAQKALLSGRRVRVEHDSANRRIHLLTPRNRTGDAPAARAWDPDPLVEPAPLTQLRIKQAWIDGRQVRPEVFQVVFVPGEAAPDISLVLERTGSGPAGTIEVALASDTTEATRTADGGSTDRARGAASGPRSIDLDDAGRGAKPW